MLKSQEGADSLIKLHQEGSGSITKHQKSSRTFNNLKPFKTTSLYFLLDQTCLVY